MNKVLSLSGRMKSGKSTIGREFAKSQNWCYVSFGDYVRKVANQKNIELKRENLQLIGEELINNDVELFCNSVLMDAGWDYLQSLVVDGVRHIEVDSILRELTKPSNYILVYIDVDDEIRQKRLLSYSEDSIHIQFLESHSTETQLPTKLLDLADYVLNGNDSVENLINRLKNFFN